MSSGSITSKLRKVFCPADARRLAENAKQFDSLPAIQVAADPLTDDQREFDRDMAYLHDLVNAIMHETYRTAPRTGTDEIRDDLRLLDGRVHASKFLYGQDAEHEIDDSQVWRDNYRRDQLDYIAEVGA